LKAFFKKARSLVLKKARAASLKDAKEGMASTVNIIGENEVGDIC